LRQLASLTTDAAGSTSTASVQTNASQTYNDKLSLNGLYSVGTGTFSAADQTTLVGPVAVSGGTIIFSGPIDSTPRRGYTLTLTPGDTKTATFDGTAGGTEPLGGLEVQAPSGGTATVTAPASIALTGDLGFSAANGLTIGPGVAATFSGGGVIRNFSGDGVLIGVDKQGQTVQNPVITKFAISGNGSPNGGADNGAGILAWNTTGGSFTSNSILNNTGSGVVINGGTGNRILSNSISGNAVGITLKNGGNNAQPAPNMVSASLDSTGTQLTVDFTVNSADQPPSGVYSVQVFYSPPGQLGAVQGVQLLQTYTGVSAGELVQKVIAVPSNLTQGGYVTVTATPSTGDTSPFSNGAQFAAVFPSPTDV
jgi:parallel beta-helix repeat protein